LTCQNGLRVEPYDSIRVLMLDFAQIRVQPVKIPVELSIKLPSSLASLFNDWIFHDVNLPSVPEEYKSAAARIRFIFSA